MNTLWTHSEDIVKTLNAILGSNGDTDKKVSYFQNTAPKGEVCVLCLRFCAPFTHPHTKVEKPSDVVAELGDRYQQERQSPESRRFIFGLPRSGDVTESTQG